MVRGQTNPAEGLSALTLNKETLSPIPLVMLLPLPSTSVSDSIQHPQKSDVSSTLLSALQVMQVPSTNRSIGRESDETAAVKDVASPVSGSKILIPLTSVKNDKTQLTLLEAPCTSSSMTKIYALKKEIEQVADIKLKPIIYIPQLNAKNQPKNKVLSNNAILKVLNIMKNNVCVEKRMETLTSSTTATKDEAEMKAEDETQAGSRLENGNPSSEKSRDTQLTSSIERDSAVIMQSHCPSLELSSQNNEQKTDKHHEEENMGLDSAVIGLDDKSDVVQCETCGEMIIEKDLVRHDMMHSDSSGLSTS